MNKMRQTEHRGWIVHTSSARITRALRFAAVALGVGLVMTAGVARAQDDEDDDSTFEEKIIKGIISGIGGTNLENGGIDYRERSPLVIPPKVTLPPPASVTEEINVPNWPKDQEVQRRKAAIIARKKPKPAPEEASRILLPSELDAARKPASRESTANSDSTKPGDAASAVLSPSQLGYDGGLFKSVFGGSAKTETAPFKGEPARQSLTQPPAGYQTPSPNFAYGTGPKESLNKEYNPAAGKY